MASLPAPPEGRAARIAHLVARLAETEAELQALTAGELDAVLHPGTGTPLLLHPAQEALRQSEARQREILSRVPIVACELAPDGATVFVNDAVTPILGWRPAELVGRPWWPALGVERAPPALLHPGAGDAAGVELTVRARDGAERTVLWTAARRAGGNGAEPGVLLFGLDLTARKVAEEAERRLAAERAARAEAEAAERRTALLSESSKLLSASLRYDATLTSIARLAVSELAEYCIVDVVEADGRVRRIDVAHPHPEAADPLQERLAARADDGELAPPIREVVRTRQPRVVARLDAGAARALAGRALAPALEGRSLVSAPLTARSHVLGAITMIAARGARPYGAADVALVEELARRAALAVDNARLYEAALAASKAKSDFLAVMSHELRTPLNAILGYADLMLLGVPAELPDPSQAQVQRVQVAARHLLQMIDEILTLSRVEAGQAEVHREEVELCAFVEEAASLVEPLAAARSLRLVCDAPEAPVRVRLDTRKTRQILLNLLGNAVKFTPDGQVVLRARVEGPDVVFAVEDSGIGIAPEHRERIFDPFWQVEQGRSRRSDGAGLGLSVTRRLARLMGGDVTVDERPAGEGTCFRVRLPAG